MTAADRDYLLGTHDVELERLGLQHRVWRPVVLDCWQRAGIGPGWRVLDAGAGPGYATLDLAELVGAGGEVVAVERSARYAAAARQACRQRGYAQVRVHELDLMSDAVPARDLDAAWCRWVATFVPAPRLLVAKIAGALRRGGVAIFHEYVDYASWRLLPPGPAHQEFVARVMDGMRAAGGEPDVAPLLVESLAAAGLTLRSAAPRVYCARPGDSWWRWPASFLDVYSRHLADQGQVSEEWVERLRRELAAAAADPNALMVTPMVLEIIAERTG